MQLLSDTWLLITLRLRLNWNSFRSRKWYFQILGAFGILMIVIFAGGFSSGVGFTAGAVLRRFPQLQLESLLPGLILTAVAALLLLNSFGIALGSLFLSNDLELLMTAPVNRQAVFISKILDGLTAYYALAFVTAAPALVTYGFGLGYGFLYYLLAFLAIIGTPLLPAAFGSLAIMLVARVAPARRVREVMGLAAALIGVTCSLIGNTSRFWAGSGDFNRADQAALLERLQQFANLPIPSFIAGRGLAAAGAGDLLSAALNLAGYLALTFGVFAVCIWLADSLYTTGWLRMQSSGIANRNKDRAAKESRRSGLLGEAAPPLALALKDWRTIPRDLRNFAQLLAPLFILPVIYLNFLSGGRRSFNAIQEVNQFGNGLVDFQNVFVAAGILVTVVMIVGRIATTGISMEGKSYWILKTAPIGRWELLTGKYLTAYIPFAILSSLLFIGVAVWRAFTPLGALYGLFGILLLGGSDIAISTGMAVPWANLDWDDPRKMSSGWGALIGFVVSAAMTVLAGSALCLPLLLRVFLPDWEVLGWLLGPLLAVAIAAGIGYLMLWVGVKFLGRVGEA